MKPRHLIAIVAVGTGLVILAPTAEKAGQADRSEIVAKPAEDDAERHAAPERAGITRVSFDNRTEQLEDTNN